MEVLLFTLFFISALIFFIAGKDDFGRTESNLIIKDKENINVEDMVIKEGKKEDKIKVEDIVTKDEKEEDKIKVEDIVTKDEKKEDKVSKEGNIEPKEKLKKES